MLLFMKHKAKQLVNTTSPTHKKKESCRLTNGRCGFLRRLAAVSKLKVFFFSQCVCACEFLNECVYLFLQHTKARRVKASPSALWLQNQCVFSWFYINTALAYLTNANTKCHGKITVWLTWPQSTEIITVIKKQEICQFWFSLIGSVKMLQ